jgi:hypothetical protein
MTVSLSFCANDAAVAVRQATLANPHFLGLCVASRRLQRSTYGFHAEDLEASYSVDGCAGSRQEGEALSMSKGAD